MIQILKCFAVVALSWRAHGRAAHRLRETSTAVHVSRDTATRRASAGGRRMGARPPRWSWCLVTGQWNAPFVDCSLYYIVNCTPLAIYHILPKEAGRGIVIPRTRLLVVVPRIVSVPGTIMPGAHRPAAYPHVRYPDFKLSADHTPPAPATPETSTVPLTLPSEVANGRDRCLLSLLGPLLGLPEALDEFLLLCEEGRARHG